MFGDSFIQSWLRVTCAVLMVSASTLSVRAGGRGNDMATAVPADVMLYWGWRGKVAPIRSGSGASGLQQSSSGSAAAFQHPQIQSFLTDFRDAATAWVKGPGAEFVSPEISDAMLGLLAALWERPCAIAVLDFGMTAFGPSAEVALVIYDPGQQRDIGSKIGAMMTSLGMPEPVAVKSGASTVHKMMLPIPGGAAFTTIDDFFVMGLGERTLGKIDACLKGEENLASSALFTRAREVSKSTDINRRGSFVLNVKRILKNVDGLLPVLAGNDVEAVQQYENFVQMTGLRQTEFVYADMLDRAGGFLTHWYVSTGGQLPMAIGGYLGEPLADDVLRRVPRDVTWASAVNMSSSVRSRQFRDYLGAQDEEFAGLIDEALRFVKDGSGVDLEADFLDQVGDTVVMYDAPSDGGLIFTGISMHTRIKDESRFVESVRRLLAWLNENPQLGVRGTLSSSRYRDHEIHFVNMTGLPVPVAPAMAFSDGWMMAGLYPQVVRSSVDRAKSQFARAESLLANEDFVRGRKLIGPMGPSMYYVDTKRGVAQAYSLALPLVQSGLAMGQAYGFEMNIGSVPSKSAMTDALFGDVYTVRKEADGVSVVSHGPLPFPVPALGGSASGAAGVGTIAVLVSILLPSLSRARDLSKRLVSQSNLKQIGLACRQYAIENDGKMPDGLQTLVDRGYIDASLLQSPKSVAGKPCYVYRSLQTLDPTSVSVVAHERTDLNNGEGVNVLFSDGSAKFLRMPEFQRVMAEQE